MKAPGLLALPPALAVQRLVLAQLDAAITASARIASRDDTEALHDFRVALRRLRSVLRVYAPWYDAVPKNLHKRLRRLAHATNAARDTEVLIEWLRRVQPRLKAGARPGCAWLIMRLAKRQRTANRAVRNLVHKEFSALVPRLRAALRTQKEGRDVIAGVTFAQVIDERLSVYCAELAAELASIGSAADREELHAARISGKRLRYLLEPLRGSVPGVVALVNSMKSFQDRLGELNDRFAMARELTQAVEIASVQAETVLPGLLELAAWVERDTKRRYRDIRARYLGRRAHKLFTPMRSLSRKLVAANDTRPFRVRLK